MALAPLPWLGRVEAGSKQVSLIVFVLFGIVLYCFLLNSSSIVIEKTAAPSTMMLSPSLMDPTQRSHR